MTKLEHPQVIRNRRHVHPHLTTIDSILHRRTRETEFGAAMVALGNSVHLVVVDPAGMGYCMNHLALAV